MQEKPDKTQVKLCLKIRFLQKANLNDLSTVATSGSRNDLLDKPSIPSVVQTTGFSTADVMS